MHGQHGDAGLGDGVGLAGELLAGLHVAGEAERHRGLACVFGPGIDGDAARPPFGHVAEDVADGVGHAGQQHQRRVVQARSQVSQVAHQVSLRWCNGGGAGVRWPQGKRSGWRLE
jgi:hypothetical protein